MEVQLLAGYKGEFNGWRAAEGHITYMYLYDLSN